jgi:hypothetical protein
VSLNEQSQSRLYGNPLGARSAQPHSLPHQPVVDLNAHPHKKPRSKAPMCKHRQITFIKCKYSMVEDFHKVAVTSDLAIHSQNISLLPQHKEQPKAQGFEAASGNAPRKCMIQNN